MRTAFTWEGMEHWTGADLIDTLLLLDSQDEADSFLSAYVDVCDDDDHALHNIAYISSLSSTEDAERLGELFDFTPDSKLTISPRQWFKDSSLGVKVATA